LSGGRKQLSSSAIMGDVSLLLLRWINSFWSHGLSVEGKSAGGEGAEDLGGGVAGG